MVRTGKVISIDRRNRSGEIRDTNGTVFCFGVSECRDEVLPNLYEYVSFEHDADWVSVKVAARVHPEAA